MKPSELDPVVTALAQGVINITEGHTKIEADSRIHKAMTMLVEAYVNGQITLVAHKFDAHAAVAQITNARLALDAASREICDMRDSRIAAVWRKLGKLTERALELRDELDQLLSAPQIVQPQTKIAPKKARRK